MTGFPGGLRLFASALKLSAYSLYPEISFLHLEKNSNNKIYDDSGKTLQTEDRKLLYLAALPGKYPIEDKADQCHYGSSYKTLNKEFDDTVRGKLFSFAVKYRKQYHLAKIGCGISKGQRQRSDS